MRLSALSGVVLLGVIAGCGGGSSVPLDSLPSTYSKTVCDQNFKCSLPEDIGDNTKQDCLDQLSSGLTFLLPELRKSVQKGRSTYDAEKAGTCFSGLAALSCEEWRSGLAQPAGCQEMFQPKTPVGGACAMDGDCIGGTCDGADILSDPPVDGVCKAEVVIAHGAACAIGDTCPDGDYCDGTCKAKKAGGEACTSSDECGYSCNETTMKCSTYSGCSVAPVTAASTLLSLAAMSLALALARRKRASAQR
jgi:hypothetical protein